ncbi:MAG: AdeC/AdeK/OprM family multidrug efflux complex outer membrane factor [Zoogloeaceae bacterium]|nr:AdeC/AdeK/OprM family multidrug efflux complex outer membrane factor [Zoogloeaceae bacterium]
MKTPALSLLTVLVLSGCMNLAPDYERPAAPVPTGWTQPTDADGVPADQLEWRQFFTEPRLHTLIEQALANNRDLRMASLAIERARAQYRIRRADRFPTIDIGASQSAQRISADVSQTGESTVSRQYAADIGFTGFELDFFGRVRNLSQAALEQFLATTEAQRAAQISLVAEIAGTWLSLAADRELLSIARETLRAQTETFELTRRSEELGVASALELNQVRTSLERARADAARYEAQVAQGRNALMLVVGGEVSDDLLPDGLSNRVTLPDLPAGVPSTVLVRRPDILEAEYRLLAANANIGAARAAMFPRISLTASAGTASTSLSGLFESGTRTWAFMPMVSIPIFSAGRLSAEVDVSRVDREIAVATYEKAIQTAFREVADVLAERATLNQRLDAQRALLDATSESFRLSEARYKGGVDSYLGVLDAQRQLYAAQQELVSVQLTDATSLVTLYKVLGGGWK